MSTLQQLANEVLSVERLHDDGVPTASIAVLKDGKIDSHVVTSGLEDKDTVYQAASISKAICALAVAKLVDDGKLGYETKVVDHLEGSLVDTIVGQSEEARKMMQHVTVKMLVSHTSGLSQHGFPGYGNDAIPSPEDVIRGKLPANTPRMRFLSPPGAQCSYSGGGFVILQLMLERIIGLPFPEIMHQIMLRPLGMSRSWYGDLNAGEMNFARAHFTAQAPAEVDRGYNILPEMAAAALWTTPTDLLKAVSAIQDSLYTTSGFVKQETAKLMLTKVYSCDSLGTAGLGWWINDIGFGHSGMNYPGYCTWVCGFYGGAEADGRPRNGISIMTNSVLGAQMYKQIIGAITYAYDWQGSQGKDEVWMPSARDTFVPYPAPTSSHLDERWKVWKGKWEGGWEILEREDGNPALRFEEFLAMKLRLAAAPVKSFEGGRKEVWLVTEGFSIGVRLTWDEEGKGEEVVKLRLEEESVLKRVS